jgi:hypothetical protein
MFWYSSFTYEKVVVQYQPLDLTVRLVPVHNGATDWYARPLEAPGQCTYRELELDELL